MAQQSGCAARREAACKPTLQAPEAPLASARPPAPPARTVAPPAPSPAGPALCGPACCPARPAWTPAGTQRRTWAALRPPPGRPRAPCCRGRAVGARACGEGGAGRRQGGRQPALWRRQLEASAACRRPTLGSTSAPGGSLYSGLRLLHRPRNFAAHSHRGRLHARGQRGAPAPQTAQSLASRRCGRRRDLRAALLLALAAQRGRHLSLVLLSQAGQHRPPPRLLLGRQRRVDLGRRRAAHCRTGRRLVLAI